MMPSASKELQDEWEDDEKAMGFLASKGVYCLKSWDWVVPDEPGCSAQIMRAMKYMSEEWDYGGWYFKSGYDKAVAEGYIDKDGRKIERESH